ncbi:MAG TPA: 4-hydroxy-3-methylbut-2-enyl diphosphate reductase [Motilibacteraceae bacterium]|nr:4-hydroxy-3-methylbut-2-enyl diphosphate reductase [Motilibacteraceae bacterium]
MSGVVLTPLRVERSAVQRGLRGVPLVRTGMGERCAGDGVLRRIDGAEAALVAGVAGGLAPQVRPGDVVVASEVHLPEQPTGGPGRVVPVTSAPMLAAALRRAGLTVHVGPLLGADGVVSGQARRLHGEQGLLAVDMESGRLAAAVGERPIAVVRAVVDTADHPLLHPGTPLRGVRALAALRRAAPVLRDWVAAAGAREVLLAGPRSFCAGVERAIETVERAIDRFGAPVYVRRQIVHNVHVVRQLEERGAVFVTELDEVPDGARVVLAAHGVAPAVRAEAARRGLFVVDATCPLVAKVHAEVRRYAGMGSSVLLVGHADHEEVEGTVGEAPEDVLVVEDVASAEVVQPRNPGQVAYVMQTTLATDEADQITDVLRRRFPSLQAPRSDDICYATTNRQRAVRDVARQVDLVLVVGSENSSNSKRLVEVAEREGAQAHLVEDAGAVDLRWLAGAGRVGITAGASAPPHLVDELVQALAGLGPVSAREVRTSDEDVAFTLPKEVV